MILEVADIHITAERVHEFAQAAHQGVQSFIRPSKGFKGYQLRQSIESPTRFLLTIEWDTLEDHTQGFRNSPAYAAWRNAVGSFFSKPPYVEHFQSLA